MHSTHRIMSALCRRQRNRRLGVESSGPASTPATASLQPTRDQRTPGEDSNVHTELRILTKPWIMTISLMAGVLAAPTMVTGCATQPQYAEYHAHGVWSDSEMSFYLQWENDTHCEHRDYDKRDADEQSEYWNWRHSHSS